jgi:nucleoside-diphosphate-sugar epimerase
MKKIIVNGGAVFVGRHIIERLLKLGNEVHCVDNLSLFTGVKDPMGGWPLYNPEDYKMFYLYYEDYRNYFKKNQKLRNY